MGELFESRPCPSLGEEGGFYQARLAEAHGMKLATLDEIMNGFLIPGLTGNTLMRLAENQN